MTHGLNVSIDDQARRGRGRRLNRGDEKASGLVSSATSSDGSGRLPRVSGVITERVELVSASSQTWDRSSADNSLSGHFERAFERERSSDWAGCLWLRWCGTGDVRQAPSCLSSERWWLSRAGGTIDFKKFTFLPSPRRVVPSSRHLVKVEFTSQTKEISSGQNKIFFLFSFTTNRCLQPCAQEALGTTCTRSPQTEQSMRRERTAKGKITTQSSTRRVPSRTRAPNTGNRVHNS